MEKAGGHGIAWAGGGGTAGWDAPGPPTFLSFVRFANTKEEGMGLDGGQRLFLWFGVLVACRSQVDHRR